MKIYYTTCKYIDPISSHTYFNQYIDFVRADDIITMTYLNEQKRGNGWHLYNHSKDHNQEKPQTWTEALKEIKQWAIKLKITEIQEKDLAIYLL